MALFEVKGTRYEQGIPQMVDIGINSLNLGDSNQVEKVVTEIKAMQKLFESRKTT